MNLLKAWSNFLFPPLCWHCESPTDLPLFCQACSELIEFSHLQEHCPRCFQPKFQHSVHCPSSRASFFAISYAVAAYGPQLKLLQEHSRFPDITKTLLSFLLVHLDRLDWNPPHLITSIPSSLFLKDPALLARAFAKTLHYPYASLLKKTIDFQSENYRYQLKKEIKNKVVWVVVDQMPSEEILRAIGTALQSGSPAKLYLLAFAG